MAFNGRMFIGYISVWYREGEKIRFKMERKKSTADGKTCITSPARAFDLRTCRIRDDGVQQSIPRYSLYLPMQLPKFMVGLVPILLLSITEKHAAHINP